MASATCFGIEPGAALLSPDAGPQGDLISPGVRGGRLDWRGGGWEGASFPVPLLFGDPPLPLLFIWVFVVASDELLGTPEAERALRLAKGSTCMVFGDAQHEQASILA